MIQTPHGSCTIAVCSTLDDLEEFYTDRLDLCLVEGRAYIAVQYYRETEQLVGNNFLNYIFRKCRFTQSYAPQTFHVIRKIWRTHQYKQISGHQGTLARYPKPTLPWKRLMRMIVPG